MVLQQKSLVLLIFRRLLRIGLLLLIRDISGVDVVYLDYSKAFDSVPHCRPIKKLSGYGFNGKLLSWLTCRVIPRELY